MKLRGLPGPPKQMNINELFTEGSLHAYCPSLLYIKSVRPSAPTL